MKLVVRSFLLTLFVTLCALAQTSSAGSSSGAADLVALERMWTQAQLSRDSAAIASMIGDRFINTEYDGEVSERSFWRIFRTPSSNRV